MTTWFRAIISLALILVLVALAPGLMYAVSLSKVHGRPIPANPANYDSHTVNQAWVRCSEALPLKVQRHSPWRVVFRLLFERPDPNQALAGERAAWRIAASHNSRYRLDPGWWHPSGAALTIWITQEWSAEEIGATLVRDGLCR